MKIKLSLFVPPDQAAAARSRFLTLGGSETSLGPHVEGGQMSVSVPDEQTPDGHALLRLAAELGEGPLLARNAVFDDRELDSAELVEVEFGDLEEPFAATSPPGWKECERCGLSQRWRGEDALLLRGKAPQRFDLISTDHGTVASERVVGALDGLKGLSLIPVQSVAKGAPGFHLLRPASSLGYDVNGYRWSEPCPTCGLRRGTPIEPIVFGLKRYPRVAWNGDDFVTTALGDFFVSQRARRVLLDPRWRVPRDIRGAAPVVLVDGAAS